MPAHTSAHLTAFTGSCPVTISAPCSLAARGSWEGGVGSWTHHDLWRPPCAAPHLPVGASCRRWTWHTHSFEFNALWPHAGLVQHVARFRGNRWYAHHSSSPRARVWVFAEFDFLPEGNEEYEEENDDKGKDSDANYLSRSDVRQRLSLGDMKRRSMKTWTK